MLPIVIAIVIGAALPVETAINSRLQKSIRSSYYASFISFFTGTILLALLLLLSHDSLFISKTFISNSPWWIWLGGIFAVVYITGNILLFPRLGAIQTVLMPIVGEILMGLLIDNFGLFSSQVYAINLWRVFGGFLVLIGIVCAVLLPHQVPKNQLSPEHSPHKNLPWQIMGIIFGGFQACQTAVNGHLGYLLHSPIKGAYLSFVIGAIFLLVVVLLQRHTLALPKNIVHEIPWWVWFGGFIGALFVLGSVYLVPIIGTGLTVIIVLFGQVIGGLVIDGFGLLGAPKTTIVPLQIVGLVVMLTGVSLIRLF